MNTFYATTWEGSITSKKSKYYKKKIEILIFNIYFADLKALIIGAFC